MKIINFDTEKYNFRNLIKDILQTDNLEGLHKQKDYEILVREKDQSTQYHKIFYDKFKSDFYPLYIDFIKNFIKKFYQEEIVYQKIPTFRVHLVKNLGVGEFHRDRDYNHGIDEINYWMPFTNVFDTNTIWIESEEGKGDFKPIKMEWGQLLEFDGANLLHGNKINQTNQTRVSIDFRVVPLSKFKPSDKGSINTKSKFDIGGYFDII